MALTRSGSTHPPASPPAPPQAGPATRRHPARRLLAAAVFTLTAAAAGTAHAQYTKTPPPETRFRVGPLRFTPVLALTNAGRDSNVFLDPTNPLADTSVTVRGSVEGFVPVRSRLRVTGEVWLDWNYYRSYDTQSSTDPGGTGRVELDLGAFTLVGGGGGLQARQLYTVDIDQRILRDETFGFAGAEWRVTRLVSLSGGVEARTYRYDPSHQTANGPGTAAALDRDTTAGQLDVRYKVTPLTTAVVTAQVIEDEFALSAPGRRTTRSYRYLAGFEFGEKAFLTGRVLVGLRDFPGDSSGSLPSYQGPAAHAEVVLPLFNRGRLLAAVGRDVYVSQTPVATAEERDRNAYILSTLSGSLEWDLPFRLLIRGTAGYTEAQYLLPQIVDGVVSTRVDHLYTAGVSLLRRFGDSVQIGGTATYYRRLSTIPGGSYDRWVYGVSAEVVP